MPIKKPNNEPAVLTIAGFDPSGGAGIIADIKTILAFDCRPVAAITSLTFQNSTGVFGADHQTPESVRGQVLAIKDECGIAATKTGMLPTREIVVEVARLFREADLRAPVDPVLRSTSGYSLMEEDAIEALLSDLMPLARLITPNIPEAERLTSLGIKDEDGMRSAARKLREMGARAVLVKGGHLPERWAVGSGKWAEKAEAIDVLDDEGVVTVFRGDWIDAPAVRGTGCMLSAAIAACLGKGMNLEEAVGAARNFVRHAIRKAD